MSVPTKPLALLFAVGAVALILPLVPSFHLSAPSFGPASVPGTTPAPGAPTNGTGGGSTGGDGGGSDGGGGESGDAVTLGPLALAGLLAGP